MSTDNEPTLEELEEALRGQQPSRGEQIFNSVVAVILIIGMPLGVLFGLNTLFGFGFEYLSFQNWIAVELILTATNAPYTIL